MQNRGFRFEFAIYPFQVFRFNRKKSTLQRHNTENSKQIFPGKELGAPVPIFRKFAVIFTKKCLSAVSMTTAIKEKHFRCTHFSYLVQSLLECTLHFEIELLLIFHFQVYRQAGIVSTDTGKKFISGIDDIDEQIE